MFEYTIQEVHIQKYNEKGAPVKDEEGNPILVKRFVAFTHLGSTLAQKSFSTAAVAARHLIQGA